MTLLNHLKPEVNCQVCKVLDVVQGVQGPLRKLAAKLMVRWKQNLLLGALGALELRFSACWGAWVAANLRVSR